MDLDPGFKDRLKWAIHIKESSQSALARHVGISAQAIQQWASGNVTSPQRDHIEAASVFLNCRFEWLAYGRGPMQEPSAAEKKAHTARHQEELHTGAVMAREWEQSMQAALPKTEKKHWQQTMRHPSGLAQMRVSWLSEHVLAEIGLYRDPLQLIAKARERLWLLAVARESVPPSATRRTILLLAPLENWQQVPDRHVGALRAEARLLGTEVIHVTTPEQAVAVLIGQETAGPAANGEDLGLDVSPVL